MSGRYREVAERHHAATKVIGPQGDTREKLSSREHPAFLALLGSLTVVEPQTPGLLTRRELSRYLQVGYNEVPSIMARFGIEALEGHYPERHVWRQILEFEATEDHGAQLLRIRLEGIGWVAKQVGRAQSTIRDHIRNGTFGYPPGVQLGGTDLGLHPRLRRWFAPELLALKIGVALAGLRPASSSLRQNDYGGLPVLPKSNVSGLESANNAEVPRHRRK